MKALITVPKHLFMRIESEIKVYANHFEEIGYTHTNLQLCIYELIPSSLPLQFDYNSSRGSDMVVTLSYAR